MMAQSSLILQINLNHSADAQNLIDPMPDTGRVEGWLPVISEPYKKIEKLPISSIRLLSTELEKPPLPRYGPSLPGAACVAYGGMGSHLRH